LTLEQALALLSLPCEVGKDPNSGEPILAGIGRYGPYVQRGKTYANLEAADDVFTIGMNRAIDLIATKEAGGGRKFGRSAKGAPTGKLLGQHPDGGEITLLDGRYGAYVKWGSVNATIPNGADKDGLTLEAALGLIAARIEANGGVKPARGKGQRSAAPARKDNKKAAPAGRPAPKKAPAKKNTARKAAGPTPD
jgi:DNA topoisomerase-1